MFLQWSAVLFFIAAASCGPDSGVIPTVKRDLSTVDAEPDDLSVPIDADTGDLATDDAAQLDGPTAYDDLGPKTDAGACMPPNVGVVCASPIAANAGCVATESCGPLGGGNGLDDNCNGVVDEGCICTPGDVQPCFLGPPGKHRVGACTDGTQTCEGAEFGSWGACKGAIGPAGESCDQLDNDCNGCADDGLCCDSTLACPSPGAVADSAPFVSLTYNGANYFKLGATAWSWTIDGGPCDRLFKINTGNPPTQSFKLSGANTATPTFKPTLSGDYTVTMNATGSDGKIYTCRWVQHVTGPGLRFELCWDHTGPSIDGGSDLDLHVHRPGTTTRWFSTQPGASGVATPDDCDFATCTAMQFFSAGMVSAEWGYPNSNLSQCKDTDAGGAWMTLNYCHNPRLDIDNINQLGRPENTNIDTPNDGDLFRAMVHYFGDSNGAPSPVEQHPIVNVYCGGKIAATYGQIPNQLSCPGSACFNHGTGWNAGQMWRVADVTVKVDPVTKKTTGCTVKALHPPGTTSGYYVTTDDTNY